MYKVFIENKPIHFHFNSQCEPKLNFDEDWENIQSFLKSADKVMDIELKDEREFEMFFKDHKFIEAAGGLVERDNTFLFILRNGVWDIPKGKLEKGETPEIGAIREIEEECGLIAPTIYEHLIDTYHTYPHKGKMVLKRTYWFWLKEGNEKVALKPQLEEGITELGYLSVEKFDQILANTFHSIADVITSLQNKLN